MSHTIKGLVNFSLVPKHHSYGIVRYLCQSKDLTKGTITATPDFLLQNLKNSVSPQSVLNLVHEHHDIMNNRHVLQALKTMFELHKHGNVDLSTRAITKHPDFERLCRKLNKHRGVIEMNDAITALKVLSYFNVPGDSKIAQVLLQLIRQNVNQLSLQNIMFLDFLLSSFKRTPLVEALQIALPLVFDIQFQTKMDPKHLPEYLYFATKGGVSKDTVEHIIQCLAESRETLDAKSAKSILWSLCEIPPDELYGPLLQKTMKELAIHIEDIEFSDLETSLSRLVGRYTRRHSYYYNDLFYDACANHVVEKDLGFKQATDIARKLARVHHYNRYLVDYIDRKVYEDPSCIKNSTNAEIYGIVIMLTLSDYRPPHWDSLKQAIQDAKDLALEHRREIIWIRFAACLCLLGIYKIDVLNKVMHTENLQHMLSASGFNSDFENYFSIWKCIRFNKPELSDLLPSKFDPVNVLPLWAERTTELPLEAALERGIGGEGYVRSKMLSKKGIKFDHVIAFRKGGYPIPIEKEIEFVEDLNLPSENQVVLILALEPYNYTINTKTLRECVRLDIKLLEEDGYHVIPVNVESWQELNDFERIPYLMQAMRNKLNDDFRASESAI